MDTQGRLDSLLREFDALTVDTQGRLDSLLREFDALSRHSVGYPGNQDFDYTALLPFMRYAINNVGDPFHDSNFRSNTHQMEREVIGIFADLMHISREQVWVRTAVTN